MIDAVSDRDDLAVRLTQPLAKSDVTTIEDIQRLNIFGSYLFLAFSYYYGYAFWRKLDASLMDDG